MQKGTRIVNLSDALFFYVIALRYRGNIFPVRQIEWVSVSPSTRMMPFASALSLTIS